MIPAEPVLRPRAAAQQSETQQPETRPMELADWSGEWGIRTTNREP